MSARVFSHLSRVLAIAAAVLAMLVLAPARAQESVSTGPTSPTSPLFIIQQLKLSIDQIEATLKRERLPMRVLRALGTQLEPIRDEIRARQAEFEARRTEVEARRKQLGPPPGFSAPPEEPGLKAERERLDQLFAELDGAAKQAGLLSLRAEELAAIIIDRQRTSYAQRLFERIPGLLSPAYWAEVGAAMPDEVRGAFNLLRSWLSFAVDQGLWRIAGAALSMLVFIVVAVIVRRWAQRRFTPAQHPQTRFAKAVAALWAFVRTAVNTPVLVFGVVWIIGTFGLMPQSIATIADRGVVMGVLFAVLGRAVANAAFAANEPQRRLLAFDDATAAALHSHLTWGTRALGLAIVLRVTNRVISAPDILRGLTDVLFALATVALSLRMLWTLRAPDWDVDGTGTRPTLWVRALAWIATIGIVVALMAGYARFGAFIGSRLFFTVALVSALYMAFVLVDGLFTDVFSADKPRGRAIAANIGLDPRRIGLVASILSAAVQVLLILVALGLIAGPWEILAADALQAARGLAFGFKIGDITFSLGAIVGAVVVFAVAVVLTRIVQRWLERKFLPATELEPSLQLSIVTIFGYIGIIAAITLALAELGIDLQKVALVAGALSVGIGFGLQAIVSNFVSGLILLAERPIRVGDWVVVKGDEGYVRRISVRSTEIETFERASVMIPNSEFITGVVKNWTKANKTGRFIVKVGVGYDSDPLKVRDILAACAREHTEVLQTPPPGVFLVAFGDSALEFELRGIIVNVERGLGVRSDLHFAILQRFREAGIEIPFPQRELRMRNGGTPPLQLGEVPEARA